MDIFSWHEDIFVGWFTIRILAACGFFFFGEIATPTFAPVGIFQLERMESHQYHPSFYGP